MSTILAYTSPALGHLLPMSALLQELSVRGHDVHLRTYEGGTTLGRQLGFSTETIDPRIEAIRHDDWRAKSSPAALKRAFAVFGRRARLEVDDLADAVARTRPDAMLIDTMCWGALSAAEASYIPWACFSPFTPMMRAPGIPPYGPGLKPAAGLPGRIRDVLVGAAVHGPFNSALPAINELRAGMSLGRARSMDDFFRSAPLTLVASGKPFEYPITEWGDAVQMIGPCSFDLPAESDMAWLATVDRPTVLVTASSEKQHDEALVRSALAALSDESLHVVATIPTGRPDGMVAPPNATVMQMVPHGAVLDRAVCAVTHGGMGATQKALARGVPVCVVPFGRDQFEVARRAEIARCGTRLPAKKLSKQRLYRKIREAMTMTDGARRVAEGFAATGGVARGADLFEQRILRLRS